MRKPDATCAMRGAALFVHAYRALDHADSVPFAAAVRRYGADAVVKLCRAGLLRPVGDETRPALTLPDDVQLLLAELDGAGVDEDTRIALVLNAACWPTPDQETSTN